MFVLIAKAYDLGNRSLCAFNTRSAIPLSDINLQRGLARGPSWTSDSSVAEVATLQIELNDLSHLTGDKRFSEAADKVSQYKKKNKFFKLYQLIESLIKRVFFFLVYIEIFTYFICWNIFRKCLLFQLICVCVYIKHQMLVNLLYKYSIIIIIIVIVIVVVNFSNVKRGGVTKNNVF